MYEKYPLRAVMKLYNMDYTRTEPHYCDLMSFVIVNINGEYQGLIRMPLML